MRRVRCRVGEPSRGTAAVEFALVLPLLVTILMGVWDLGRLVAANQVLANAAREGGRQASTGNLTTANVQQTVVNSLTRAGFSTTNLTFSLVNLTSAGRSDPTTATQLDQFQLVVTLPSNNVRFIVLSKLIGVNTLSSTTTWASMNDIPLAVNTSVPIN